jgi:hypothetical protein
MSMNPFVRFCASLLLIPALVPGAAAQTRLPQADSQWIAPAHLAQAGASHLPHRHRPPAGPSPAARLAYWNEVALNAIAIDHTPPAAGGPPGAGEQLGPTRSSRVLAIVHIAIHDALNAIVRRYPGYSGPLTAFAHSSRDAAIAQATHDTLAALYPRQAARLDALLRHDLARLPDGREKLDGVDIGRRAAAAILQLRENDGSRHSEAVIGVDYFPGRGPGEWRQDPVRPLPLAFGARWGQVKPFVLASSTQIPSPPPPPLNSEAYAHAFNEVKRLGGDGIRTPTARSAEQTVIGIFWAYDGGAWVGPPPRLYNQIAVQLGRQRTRDPLELARMLALVNVAIADATIAVFEAKYQYRFWRPVTAIRETDATGPVLIGDPNWTPLGVPATNLNVPNFTPPFPACPAGHSGLGSAMFQILRRMYGDNVAFTFVSDEYNGINRDNQGRVRPRLPRSFATLSQAEEENSVSRVYLGVHWKFDNSSGLVTGRRIADYVFMHGLVQPSN